VRVRALSLRWLSLRKDEDRFGNTLAVHFIFFTNTDLSKTDEQRFELNKNRDRWTTRIYINGTRVCVTEAKFLLNRPGWSYKSGKPSIPTKPISLTAAKIKAELKLRGLKLTGRFKLITFSLLSIIACLAFANARAHTYTHQATSRSCSTGCSTSTTVVAAAARRLSTI
jgi:hypothetical protein